jgi:hypothetical protein
MLYCSQKKYQYDDAVTSRGETSTMLPQPTSVTVSRGWLTGSDVISAIGNSVAYANCVKNIYPRKYKIRIFPKAKWGQSNY